MMGAMTREPSSWATTPATRRSMQGNKARDTSPELAVRRLLHAKGLRYRVNVRPLPDLRRTADIVFTKQKIAVLIDGCFWHGCPEHYTRPAANREFWDAKVNRNRERDADTDRELEKAGWTVVRFWEHEAPTDVAESIRRAVES
ncbi:very short patch repair endonuclease [Cryobacterium serini]|uniref:Very short patch repair endonuclease n=2 Tax=Cryobacterium serini TaxID=1259201 RepID=A0A4V3IXJ9_9MICO|nr:very short patch repair endonuclease [Cryobacterium serini]